MKWVGQLTRLPYARGLWKRFPVGPLDLRFKWGIHDVIYFLRERLP
jgi:hypothetical protein